MCLQDVLSLYMSPQLDMAQLCPRSIKEHTLVKGEMKGQLGGIERVEWVDGTYSETENMTGDKSSRVQQYMTKDTDKKCYQGVREIKDTFTH